MLSFEIQHYFINRSDIKQDESLINDNAVKESEADAVIETIPVPNEAIKPDVIIAAQQLAQGSIVSEQAFIAVQTSKKDISQKIEKETYQEATFDINYTLAELQVPENLKDELSKQPLNLNAEELQNHIQPTKQLYDLFLSCQKSYAYKKEVNTSIYSYIQNFLQAIVNLGSSEAYMHVRQHVLSVLYMLKTLCQNDLLMHTYISNLIESEPQVEKFSWNLFISTQINCLLNALITKNRIAITDTPQYIEHSLQEIQSKHAKTYSSFLNIRTLFFNTCSDVEDCKHNNNSFVVPTMHQS